MNVLMVNHPAAEGFRGGDLVQMRQTAAALRQFGVRVSESFAPDPSPTGFDLAHVFNLRTARETLAQLVHLKGFGVPVVLSPLYLDPGPALWGSRAVAGFFQDDPTPDLLARRLAALRDRTAAVTVPDGRTYTAHAPNRPHPGYDQAQRAAVGLADLILVNSELERHALLRTLRVTDRPVAVAHLGIDPAAFRSPDPGPFRERVGGRPFVLQAGRVEAPKNQLLLAMACKQAGLPLVLAGSCRQPRYLDWVRRHGPTDLLVVPHLPPAELASAYAACRVHALPSWAETCGLVNLEAGACGAAVVAGVLGYECEYLVDLADYCDPADVDAIAAAVRRAWDRDDPDRTDRLRRRVLDRFTWAESTRATFAAYRQVLGALGRTL